MPPSPRPAPLLLGSWLLALALVAPILSQAQQPSPGPSSSAPATSASSNPAPSPERQTLLRILELFEGSLDVKIDPQTLFEPPLEDEGALRLAAARSRALLREVTEPPGKKQGPLPALSAGALSPAVEAAAQRMKLEPSRLAEALELEQERLRFYELEAEQRGKLLAAHRERQETARAAEAAKASEESEEARRAKEAEEERQRALKAAQQARSEADRLVSEELARLLGLEKTLVARSAELDDERKRLLQRRDELLGLRQRARASLEQGEAERDASYRELQQRHRKAREEMSGVMEELRSSKTRIPALGDDPLRDFRGSVSTEKVKAQRQRLEALRGGLLGKERRLLGERAEGLLDELDGINQERLGLLPRLSTGLRASELSFSERGLEQARAEVAHLKLILQAHGHTAQEWLRGWRDQQGSAGEVALRLATAVPWLLLLVLFAWWRRGSRKLFEELEERLEREERRHPFLARRGPVRLYRFLLSIRRTVELMLLVSAMHWLLPEETRALLEVQLLTLGVSWSLAGSLVVTAINTLASGGRQRSGEAARRDRLRLRSLRLVGRTVVLVALLLAASTRLVGEGTIHHWILSLSWLTLLPLFLLLVHWWRGELLARLRKEGSQGPLHRWVLERPGASFGLAAASLAALYLGASAAARLARGWVNGFNLARKAHAYLFQRELDKLNREHPTARYSPLSEGELERLGPGSPSVSWIAGPEDDAIGLIKERVEARQGNVIALVGARGMGKSTMLRQLRQGEDALWVDGEGEDLEFIRRSLADQLDLDSMASLSAIGAALDQETRPRLLLLDGARALIRPIMDGLAGFDQLVNVARSCSQRAVWVIAIDAVVWKFLSCARGVYPLFDEVIFLKPWGEDRIAELLQQRTGEVELAPSFERLLEEPVVDELELAEALQERKASYFRLLWDQAGGNPGVALELWRHALVRDEGGKVQVKPLRTPDAKDLEQLPDEALFVLRAILQLSPATPEQVEAATGLDGKTIQDALRYGLAHDYLQQRDQRYLVSWSWYPLLEQLLQRRQLLVKP